MQLVFVDETSDSKFKEYLGFCVVTMNAKFYPQIKERAQAILLGIGWDPEIEFKGSYLFSAKSGCKEIDIERRIDAAHKLIDLHIAEKNRRMAFHYGDMQSTNHGEAYLFNLPSLLLKVLPKAKKGPGKNLLLVHCDYRQDVDIDQLHFAISAVARRKGYVLFERVEMAHSTFDTVGLMYADLVAYLQGRIDTISHDSELFEGITEEQFRTNGKLKKLVSSVELISKVRKMSILQHKDKAGEPLKGSDR